MQHTRAYSYLHVLMFAQIYAAYLYAHTHMQSHKCVHIWNSHTIATYLQHSWHTHARLHLQHTHLCTCMCSWNMQYCTHMHTCNKQHIYTTHLYKPILSCIYALVLTSLTHTTHNRGKLAYAQTHSHVQTLFTYLQHTHACIHSTLTCTETHTHKDLTGWKALVKLFVFISVFTPSILLLSLKFIDALSFCAPCSQDLDTWTNTEQELI